MKARTNKYRMIQYHYHGHELTAHGHRERVLLKKKQHLLKYFSRQRIMLNVQVVAILVKCRGGILQKNITPYYQLILYEIKPYERELVYAVYKCTLKRQSGGNFY